jgi:hypothetical protein
MIGAAILLAFWGVFTFIAAPALERVMKDQQEVTWSK